MYEHSELILFFGLRTQTAALIDVRCLQLVGAAVSIICMRICFELLLSYDPIMTRLVIVDCPTAATSDLIHHQMLIQRENDAKRKVAWRPQPQQ